MKKDNLDRVPVYGRLLANILLLDEVFVISRIINQGRGRGYQLNPHNPY